ncbi:hypothetical protein FS749_006202 [Ceratobasidium sp. UAMH 11750]|nr:hypothetical protein FS749_006202 [Ceratobasidium sp. UAMH 11750]
MATIHPSRLGLVPGPSAQPRQHERRRSPSRERDDDSRGRTNWGRKEHDSDDRAPARRRSTSREPQRDAERRASPAYGAYEKPPPPAAPWRQEANSYPPRDGSHRGNGWAYGGGGPDFLESRRQQRLASTLSIWPPSPKHPEREDSPARGKSKKSKRRRYDSSDSSDSSDDERSRRRRKEKEREKEKKRKRHEKEKSRSDRHKGRDRDDHDSKHSSRQPKRRSDSVDSDHDRRRHERERSPSVNRRIDDLNLDAKPKSRDRSASVEEDMWIEKPVVAPTELVAAPLSHQHQQSDQLEDAEIGPMPAPSSGGKLSERE